jgi:hypothetical protein
MYVLLFILTCCPSVISVRFIVYLNMLSICNICTKIHWKFLFFFYFNFRTVHFVLCLCITKNASILLSLLFHFAPPTCVGNCVPFSGTSSIPSELHANLVDKILCSMWLCECYVTAWCTRHVVSSDLVHAPRH